MPEILTESFCERCGTRYTFEAAAPKARRFGALKILSKGLVNFVANDETSLDEAFADARNEQQRVQTTDQLDAFHKTFQFCMSCRQYTCGNCWNEAEGRCLSCAPHLGQEVLGAPFANLDAAVLDAIDAGPDEHGQNGRGAPLDLGTLAWPTTDLPLVAGPSPEPEPVAQALADISPAAAVQPTEPPVAALDAAVEGEPNVEPAAAVVAQAPERLEADPSVIDDDVAEAAANGARRRAAAAASQSQPGHDLAAAAIARTTDLFARLRPGRRTQATPAPQDLEAMAPAASPPEAVPATVSANAAPTTFNALTASGEAVDAQPTADLGVDAVIGQPPASPAPTPRTEPAAPTPNLPPQQDPTQTPIWSMVAPESIDSNIAAAGARRAATGSLGPQSDLPPTAASARSWHAAAHEAAPEWPTRPAVVAATRQGPDLWVASSQDVLNRPGSGVQACVSCGLPLSATARFCRRCGSQQH